MERNFLFRLLKQWLPPAVLLGSWVLAGALRAQDKIIPAATAGGPAPEPIAAPPLPKGEFEITKISGYMVYYSNGLPLNGGLVPGATNGSPDAGFGGSAEFDWTKFTERTTFALSYTPSYVAQARYSSLNALNHSISLNVSRKVAPRWTLAFSTAGDLSTLDQSLFAPTTLGTVAAVPATFTDLAAALLTSKFTSNPVLGIALTNAPILQSPLQTLLYGQRMLTSSAQAALSFSYSPRLTVTFSGGGNRLQHMSDQSATTANAYLIPNTTSGNAGVSFSYSYSPVWQIGGSATTNRISSSLQDAYITTSLATVSRTLGARWILQFHGGIGSTSPLRQTGAAASTGPHPSVGGGIVFKTPTNTFLGTVDRTVSDPYGIGATATTSGEATWRWQQPGHSWWIESSLGWQKLAGNAYANNTGWHASSGIGRVLNPQFTFLVEYTYLTYSGLLQNTDLRLSKTAVRASLQWSPHPVVPGGAQAMGQP